MYPKQTIAVNKRLYHLISGFCMAGLLLLVSAFRVASQEQDTAQNVTIVQKHSPRKAVLYSFIFPGLGQVYNKKYWKLPFIYGAGGTFAYYISFNQLKYKKFRDAYVNGKAGEMAFIDGSYFSHEILPRGRDYYRRYRDLSILGFGAIYLLAVVDAMVDASFFYYDVSDDLTMRLEPVLIEGPGMSASLGFRINFGF